MRVLGFGGGQISEAAGGFAVANSLRFDDGSSDYLNRTPSSDGNRQKFTISTWVKRGNITSYQYIFSALTSVGDKDALYFANDDTLWFIVNNNNAGKGNVRTAMILRDVSAWYHICVAIDTTQSTASNRVKIYINGIQQTSFSSAGDGLVYPAQNYNFEGFNTNRSHNIGKNVSSTNYLDGYLSEFVFIDGQQLDPTSFGEFDEDTGIWKPIDVSGLTFGTNGFYLDFENSGSLGADVSGNGNNFTVNNLTSIDQTTDTPTNNYCTLNPLVTATSFTDNQNYSEGNTIIIPNSTDNYGTTFSTLGVQGSGKWYWEAQIVWNGTSNNANFPRTIGFVTEDYAFNYSYLGQDGESWGIIFADAATDIWKLEHGGSSTDISGATSMANGDTIMLALDLDNGKFYAGRNGSWFTSGDPTSGATGTGAIATLTATDLSKFIIPAVTNATNTTYYKFNFGNPAFTISSGNSDGNGYGNFEYAVPSGYYALNTKNLAEFG